RGAAYLRASSAAAARQAVSAVGGGDGRQLVRALGDQRRETRVAGLYAGALQIITRKRGGEPVQRRHAGLCCAENGQSTAERARAVRTLMVRGALNAKRCGKGRGVVAEGPKARCPVGEVSRGKQARGIVADHGDDSRLAGFASRHSLCHRERDIQSLQIRTFADA